MKKFLVVIICLLLSGCVTINVYEKKVEHKQMFESDMTTVPAYITRNTNSQSGTITLNKCEIDTFMKNNNLNK